MGQGRRMRRKQGAPEPLSEEHFARLKRKAGFPVDTDEQIIKTTTPKKRRTAKKLAALKNKNVLNHAENFGSACIPEKSLDISASKHDEKLDNDFLSADSLVDSEEEELTLEKRQFVFSDDESGSDNGETLTAANIDGLSRKLDEQLEKERAYAEAEVQASALQTNLHGDRPMVFGFQTVSGDEAISSSASLLAPDLQLLRQRIIDIIRILDNFSKLSEDGRSRAEYTSQLLQDISAYYNYSPFLAEKLYNIFTPREAFAFFEANEVPRPIVIRTNTLRTHRRDLAQALINRGVTLEPVGKWTKVGLQVFESSIPLGATPEYLAGHYILQAASSFLPVMALSPQPGERVLDMAAAPGGKTTHCAAMMKVFYLHDCPSKLIAYQQLKNTGVVVANDPNRARAKGLIGNIHRLGAKNVIVCSYDAREFPRIIGGFDRVLLDAPCSGTGVIAKDPTVKNSKTEKDFMTLPHIQKQLLLSAIDSVNHAGSGGCVVYSTCSITVEENEQVVAYALSRRPNVKLVDTGLPFGREGFTRYMGKTFDPSLKLTRRYYPHTYNVDGFYVAKMQKIGPTPALTRGSGSVLVEPTSQFDKASVVNYKFGAAGNAEESCDFGNFDENGDKEYIDRARRSSMRRKGYNPRKLCFTAITGQKKH